MIHSKPPTNHKAHGPTRLAEAYQVRYLHELKRLRDQAKMQGLMTLVRSLDVLIQKKRRTDQ